MDIERASALARECGFEEFGSLDVSTLEFRQDVRDMCNAQGCPTGFNKSWSCPPVIPDVEEQKKRIEGFTQGIIVQTVGQMEDEFDYETIQETSQAQKKKFHEFIKRLDEETEGPTLPMGSGACSLCPECTYPDEACRYPDKMLCSMEACGLWVSQVCSDNDLKYNYGKNTIAFTSCCLF